MVPSDRYFQIGGVLCGIDTHHYYLFGHGTLRPKVVRREAGIFGPEFSARTCGGDVTTH